MKKFNVQIDDLKGYIREDSDVKLFRSKEYNYNFSKVTGRFQRWGKTRSEHDDPIFSPFGPELLDIELTTKCAGYKSDNKPCQFCYKSNTQDGTNMSFDVFKDIFESVSASRVLTQIAFGVDARCQSNPETFKIMRYCRDNGVIPNVTVANICTDIAEQLANVCGAVAVSRYEDASICYESIRKLHNAGLTQINIHALTSKNTYDMIRETFDDYLHDKIPGLNAIVLLSLKKKGRGSTYESLSQTKFSELVRYALDNKIPIGFDSCSYPKFLRSIDYLEQEDSVTHSQFLQQSEPCESGLFSFYCDTNGIAYACSFMEGEDMWKEGIDLTQHKDFVKDVWYSEKVVEWRTRLLENKRACPVYNV